jgi:hypothetical protein
LSISGRHVVRLYLYCSLELLRYEHPYHPSHHRSSFYIHWLILNPVVQISKLRVQEVIMQVSVIMMTRTTTIQPTSVRVRSDCPDEEFLNVLRPIFIAMSTTPWTMMAENIAAGQVFPPDLLRCTYVVRRLPRWMYTCYWVCVLHSRIDWIMFYIG